MSTMSFYDVSVKQALEVLDSLAAILQKAAACTTPDPSTLPSARIHADMLPLTFQVYFVCELSVKLAARLSGRDPAVTANDLKTMADMTARIEHARRALGACDRAEVDGGADEVITFGLRPGKEATMPARLYYATYMGPNLFFHLATAYNILRKEGVPLGKGDYLTPFFCKHVEGLD